MSYEGSVEYICENSHYQIVDCWTDLEKCRRCGGALAWCHSINVTNGVIDDDPGTIPAKTQSIGYEDDWHIDHHGNRYAIKIEMVEPADPTWREL